ncbi:hypothetical protein LBMAG42_24740 [Deltaproteobacteria bacterium]|nr:hypothetical protein LBMAG42_24740 [Deltaproteobacteria bacterium]
MVALGLGSRRFGAALPAFVASYAGDTLYATMMVVLLGYFTRTPAVPALVVCFGIEFSQAVHAPWLDAIRSTLPGRLVLGQGFMASDLICYLVGAAVGWAVDRRLRGAAAHADSHIVRGGRSPSP